MRNRRCWLAVLMLVYGISVAIPRTSLPHIPLCGFQALTGRPCPTCGLTRAFCEIGHGRFTVAGELNLLAVPAYLLGLLLAGLLLVELATRRSLITPFARRYQVLLLILLAGGVGCRYLAWLGMF